MHALKVHFYGRFTCAICTFRGDFARELMDHMAQDHKEVSTAKCPICDQESSLENIENHYRNCVKIKLTKSVTDDKCEQVCPTCGKILKTRDELYKNRSSRKTDSLLANRSSGSPILLKIVSENLIFREDLFLYNCLQEWLLSASSDAFAQGRSQEGKGSRQAFLRQVWQDVRQTLLAKGSHKQGARQVGCQVPLPVVRSRLRRLPQHEQAHSNPASSTCPIIYHEVFSYILGLGKVRGTCQTWSQNLVRSATH